MTDGTLSTPEWREPIALLPAALPPLRKHILAYLDYKAKRITPATQICQAIFSAKACPLSRRGACA